MSEAKKYVVETIDRLTRHCDCGAGDTVEVVGLEHYDEIPTSVKEGVWVLWETIRGSDPEHIRAVYQCTTPHTTKPPQKAKKSYYDQAVEVIWLEIADACGLLTGRPKRGDTVVVKAKAAKCLPGHVVVRGDLWRLRNVANYCPGRGEYRAVYINTGKVERNH